MVGLAISYQFGMGCKENMSTAVNYYKQAAEQGSNYAQYRLYGIYRDGEGIAKNQQLAIQYLRQAADDDYSDALYSLGYEYAVGEILHQEKSKAVEYMTRAAEKGDAFASAVIGTMYYSGDPSLDIEKDYKKAFYYLGYVAYVGKLSNKELLAEVYRDLGACYRFGRGTDVNQSMASFYTEKAAELGDENSLDAVKLLRKDN